MSPSIRNLHKKNQRLDETLSAVNRLHSSVDGACSYCGTTYPCDTRAVMRQGRTVADTTPALREDKRAEVHTLIDSIHTYRAAERDLVEQVIKPLTESTVAEAPGELS